MKSPSLCALTSIAVGVFIIVGLRVSSAQEGDKAMQNSSSNVIITNDFEGVVFEAEKKAFSWALGNSVSYWTPSKAEIVQMEILIAGYLKERTPTIYSKLKMYKRQYVGFIMDRKNYVFVNFFCRDHGKDWKKEEVIVMDGGDCYFRIKVDLTLNRCFDLIVNGEA